MKSPKDKDYSVWMAIPYSFLFGDLYRDVAKNWKDTGFGYLFLVVVLACVPRAIKVQSTLSEEIAKDYPKLIQSIPDFKLEKGQLSVAVKQPYYSPSQAAPIFVIDTTGKITSLSQVKWAEKADSVILVTKSQIMTRRVRFGVSQEQTTDLSKLGAFDVNKQSLGHLADFLARWSGWIAYPFLVWGLFVYNMLAVAVYGLIGLGASKAMGLSLDYSSSVRLSVVSHTPSIFLGAALFAAGIEIPLGFLAFLILSTFFLSLAIRAAGLPSAPAPSNP